MAQVVLGGGIGGLSAAHYMSKYTVDGIKLIEGSQRLGGWIKSTVTENGTLFEQGPRTIRVEGTGLRTLELLTELKLHDAIRPIDVTNDIATRRLLWVDNKLHEIPKSFFAMFRKNAPFEKSIFSAIRHDFKTPKMPLQDDSVYGFVERRFGKDFAEFGASAMVCGICAGDAKEISVKTIMKNYFEYEQNYGSVLRGVLKLQKKTNPKLSDGELLRRSNTEGWTVWSLDGGLEMLPMRLGNHLMNRPNVELHLGSSCKKIELKKDSVVITTDKETETAKHLYSAIPCRELAKLIGDDHKFLKDELSSIPFVTVGVVNLEFEGDVLQKKGFGFLIPPNQNSPILGVIFDSCLFPQEGKTVLTVMMGGKWFEERLGFNPKKDKLLEIAVSNVRNILKIDKEVKNSQVSILENCIPQHVVGHEEKIKQIRKYIEEKNLPISLIGSSYDGISINDVISSSRNAVINNCVDIQNRKESHAFAF